jgi:hypothetical protein
MKIQPRCESPQGCHDSGGYVPVSGRKPIQPVRFYCAKHRRKGPNGKTLPHHTIRQIRMRFGHGAV